jgi:uncharacterized protein
MKLEQSFEVAAPLERVWQALIDVEQVAPCLPGAAVTGRNDDGTYNGTFTVKIGPTTASYSGKLEMEGADEGEHLATMNAQGTDKRGQGGATAKIVSRLEAVDDDHTRVSVDTDYRITGRLARFGRGGMIEDISERLLKEFAQRLQSSLESGGGASAAGAADAPAEDEPAPLPPDEAAAAGSEEGADADDAADSGPTEAAEPAPPEVSEPAPAEAAEPAPAEAPEAAPTEAVEPAPTEAPEAAPTEAAEPAPAEAPEAAPAEAPEPAPTDAPEPAPTEAPEPPPQAAAAPAPNEPLDAGSLVGSVILARIKANPWPWVGGVFVLWRLMRRRRR